MKEGKAFLDALDRKAKIFAPTVRAHCEANDELCSWLLDPLARWAQAAYGQEIFDVAASGYASCSLGVAKAQQVYERSGKFNTESMPQIVSHVYEAEDYMVPYMWWAILIYAFWPSMLRHIGMYREEYLRKLPQGASVLEFASGHGVLSLLAAEERPDIRVYGVDISAPAVAVANKLRGVSGHSDRVSFIVRDALQEDSSESMTKYQGITAPMLAEHLLTPQPLFAAMARHLGTGGLIFFSTAIESAQRDHVYEFHRESEPLKMAEDVGLRASCIVSDGIIVLNSARFLPRAIAMILHTR